MADIPSSSDGDTSEPKLVSFSTLKTIARQLPRYRHGGQGGGPNAGGGGGGDGFGQGDKFGTGGRDNKKLPRSTTNSGGLVTLDMVNGKLVSNVHGISLIQAARDGLLDVVKSHLESGHSRLNDVDEDGYTALHYAARYNRDAVMQVLVEAGADINSKQGQDEVTPLHLACRYNSRSATQFLLSRAATSASVMNYVVNIKDVKGRTPLHYATRRGHDMVIKMLLSSPICNVNAMDNDLTTPLIMAALQGNAIICESLISRGADIERKDINDMCALMWAAAEGHTEVAKVLLKAAQRHGTNNEKNYIKACDKEGNTALHLAVQNGSIEVVNLLLSHGADVNCEKNNLSTPLHVAATYGFLDIAKILVYNGAEINSRDLEQSTPIHRAALYNKVEILEFLVKRGGNINAKDKKNMLPLHCACWKGQTKAVEFLLNNGAQIAEVDSSLKTALHWAVQFGHFETLLTLLKHGGKNLLGSTDKNDQTVLHYAAYTGNVAVLKTLLEVGARPDAKDQEESAALHIAAQNGHVSCVEALIQASNHETNDDDVDGRTPLLLACLNGHHHAVQVLLTLGGDVTNRDDEHCSALMLAAAAGHTVVMKILLDNHASVNDVDKMKHTALHYACLGGHVEAVQLLVDKKADVTLKNTYNHSPLDLAIDNMHHDVVIAMLRNKSVCQACMSVRDHDGKSVFDRLIAKMPDAVRIVLDHCVERTSRDDDEPSLSMSFDYQYIDPGPDDPGCTKNRYLALNTMVVHERDGLLSHPLCQNLLSQKWVKFGRFMFFMNLLMYLGYLGCLTAYVYLEYPDLLDAKRGCPIIFNHTEDWQNTTLKNYLRENGQFPPPTNRQGVRYLQLIRNLLYFFLILFAVRDILKIFSQKWKYLFSFYNFIVWVLVGTTLTFIVTSSADMKDRCLLTWRSGWIAMFLAWINFIMYLRRIDFMGIYVIMFVTVLSSLLKVVFLFVLFAAAFAGSFYIVMQDVPVFQINSIFLNIIVMTLGEIEFNDIFLETNLDPFGKDVRIILFIFLFLMPIVLMNLLIGVAVGDIEKVQRNAYLKRIGLQVDLMYNIENNMPKFIQRVVHVKRAVVKPNEKTKSILQFITWFLLGSSRKVQFIEAGDKDKVTSKLEALTEKVRTQQSSLKAMQLILQQQTTILSQIANKLNVTVEMPTLHVLAPRPSIIPLEGLSVPDALPAISGGIAAGPPGTGVERLRQRSVRVALDRNERPRSTVL